MRLVLDTDTCIAIINRDERIRLRLEQTPPSQLRMTREFSRVPGLHVRDWLLQP